jgi:hypothetical protein
MQLSIGDYISGKSISIGKYLGENIINDITFHKIFDTSKNLVIYVPVGNESELRKLPSKGTVEKYLNMFKDQEVIDRLKKKDLIKKENLEIKKAH